VDVFIIYLIERFLLVGEGGGLTGWLAGWLTVCLAGWLAGLSERGFSAGMKLNF